MSAEPQPQTDLLAIARKTLTAEQARREAACEQAINDVLVAHGCRLAAEPVAVADGFWSWKISVKAIEP